MTPELLEALKDHGEEIQARWSALLHVEPVTTPLATPDALDFMIPEAFECIIAALAHRRGRAPQTLIGAKIPLPACDCGRNPYRAFYVAGEQAINEGVILAQAELPAELRRTADLAAAIYTVRNLAASEIDNFCAVCTCRGDAPNCRHAATAR